MLSRLLSLCDLRRHLSHRNQSFSSRLEVDGWLSLSYGEMCSSHAVFRFHFGFGGLSSGNSTFGSQRSCPTKRTRSPGPDNVFPCRRSVRGGTN